MVAESRNLKPNRNELAVGFNKNRERANVSVVDLFSPEEGLSRMPPYIQQALRGLNKWTRDNTTNEMFLCRRLFFVLNVMTQRKVQ